MVDSAELAAASLYIHPSPYRRPAVAVFGRGDVAEGRQYMH